MDREAQGRGLSLCALGFGQAERQGEANRRGSAEPRGADEGEQFQRIEHARRARRRIETQALGGHGGVGDQDRALGEQVPCVRRTEWGGAFGIGHGGARAGQDDQGWREGQGGGGGVHRWGLAEFARRVRGRCSWFDLWKEDEPLTPRKSRTRVPPPQGGGGSARSDESEGAGL